MQFFFIFIESHFTSFSTLKYKDQSKIEEANINYWTMHYNALISEVIEIQLNTRFGNPNALPIVANLTQ